MTMTEKKTFECPRVGDSEPHFKNRVLGPKAELQGIPHLATWPNIPNKETSNGDTQRRVVY
jgi:hypothetical protein